jgi:predicted alpha/beta superfamily hydrolase
MGEEREIRIALPESYGQTTIAYPVLYLLDGSPQKLVDAAAIVRFLASARNRIPEMIVVAIPNTNRNRDLTPGPGAAKFERFLGEELIPWVERSYRAAPDRILVGHSLGGSFAVHALLNRVELFAAYVAISAPVWRYDSLAQQVEAGLGRAAKAGATLTLLVGQNETTQLRDGVRQLAELLRGRAPNAPASSYAELPDEDHSSTPHRGLYAALEGRYREWRFPFLEDSTELAKAGGLEALEAHYERFSRRFGYPAPPPLDQLQQVGRLYVTAGRHAEVLQLADKYASRYPPLAEFLINLAGYDQLRRGGVEEAVRTFRKNAELFPNSLNVYDSLGDGYCRAGKSEQARASYQRAATLAQERGHPRFRFYQDKADKACAP